MVTRQRSLQFSAASNKTKRGFTLIEMLVVLAIIGVLAAILVPSVNFALKRVKEVAKIQECKQIAAAIESYKTKFGAYPIDFADDTFIVPHIAKLAPNANLTVFLGPDKKDNGNWMNAAMPNPNVGLVAGTPATRRFNTMQPTEAWVFLLGELSKNPEYPLGYRYDGSNFVLVTGEKHSFFEFKPGQLRDADQDGWLEYVPTGGKVPYVYFDARTYTKYTANDYLNTNIASDYPYFPANYRLHVDFQTNVAGLSRTGITGSGYAVPYYQPTGPGVEPTKFQLISPGLDNQFGSLTTKIYPTGAGMVLEDYDNVASFADARLDAGRVE